MARQQKRPGDTTGQTALKLAEEHKEELSARQNEISLINAIQDESKLNEVMDLTGGGNATLAQVAAVEAELERKNSVTDTTDENYGVTVQPGQSESVPGAGGLSSGTITSVLGTDGFLTITFPNGSTQRVKTNSTALTGLSGAESPSAVPGGNISDARLRTVVDTTNPVTGSGIKGVSRDSVGEFGAVREEGSVQVESPAVTIRVNSDLPQVTIGAGNVYDFEEGRQYKVPKHVADHLEEKGYIYH